MPLPEWLPHAAAPLTHQQAEHAATSQGWPGDASSPHSGLSNQHVGAQQLEYWSRAANITAAGFPVLPNEIPILQATIVLEDDESCCAAGNTIISSMFTDISSHFNSSISANSSWLAVPLVRSISDVTSYSTSSSSAAGHPAALARSISDVDAHTTTSSHSRQIGSSAHQPSQQGEQQQQCRPSRQRLLLLQQLHARAKPAATAKALQLAGRWWHQDAHQLSELLLLPDGTMAWLKQSHAATSHQAGKANSTSSSGITSSMAAAASKMMQLLSSTKRQAAAAAAAAGSSDDEPRSCSWSLQPYECVAEWRGSWQLTEGNAKQGKLRLTFLASSLERHQQGSGCTRSQKQQQQQTVVSFERGALEDVLVLDGLAHVKTT
jgi:hypothetical protein